MHSRITPEKPVAPLTVVIEEALSFFVASVEYNQEGIDDGKGEEMRACRKLGKRLLMSGYRNETHVRFVLTETSLLATISPRSITCSTPTSRGNPHPPSPTSCSVHSTQSTPVIR